MKRLLLTVSVLFAAACGATDPTVPAPSATSVPTAEGAIQPGQTPLPSQSIPDTAVFDFGKARATVEIADESAEQQVGLMGRRSMPADHGMLFEFDSEGSKAFWMKNTLIPLSIAYMNRSPDGRYVIRTIVDMEPCKSDPCETYPSGADDINSALEMNKGWFAANGIGVGAVAALKRR